MESPVISSVIMFIGLLAVVWYLRRPATLEAITPDWRWVAEHEAEILTKAAYQLFPKDQTDEMLLYVQAGIYKELALIGIVPTPEQKEKIRQIIEAKVVDLKAQLLARQSAPPPEAIPDHK